MLSVGKKADEQGGALSKDGSVGKQFTKEGAIGASRFVGIEHAAGCCVRQ